MGKERAMFPNRISDGREDCNGKAGSDHTLIMSVILKVCGHRNIRKSGTNTCHVLCFIVVMSKILSTECITVCVALLFHIHRKLSASRCVFYSER